MKHCKTALILTALTLGAGGISQAKPPAPIAIALAPGKHAATARGRLTGAGSKAVYTLRGKKGQKLTARTKSGGPTVVTVVFPSGEGEGAPGGTEVTLPATGKYRIEVTEHGMAEPWKGSFTLEIRLD